jgi:hypothetical protein
VLVLDGRHAVRGAPGAPVAGQLGAGLGAADPVNDPAVVDPADHPAQHADLAAAPSDPNALDLATASPADDLHAAADPDTVVVDPAGRTGRVHRHPTDGHRRARRCLPGP